MGDPLELYFEIKKQRWDITAPVDTMGCFVTPGCSTEEERMLHVMISLMLSSQTRDEVTYEAMRRLRMSLPEGHVCVDGAEYNGLTVENINRSSVEHINRCVEKVGFHNRKSESIKKVGRILEERGLPRRLEDVVELPGVGNKMGILYMSHACGEVVGISVDTHVHRISNRIGLVDTRDVSKTRAVLERTVPKGEWGTINRVLVGFGQTICLPRNPRCSECCIKDRCPSSLF